ncbi:RDD family protein [Candidatus Woesearchaeota archaeon]|nr:RDD family protein [Candidatus Woesearchaeota archaeon]
METEKELRYAGFWIRFAAFLLDYIILMIPNFIISLPFAVLQLFFASGDSLEQQLVVFLFGMARATLIMLVDCLYFSIMESSKYQATLGKLIVGVKVVDIKGTRLSFWRALGRYFSKFLSWITLGVGMVIIAFTKKKQGLHDMVAQTYVVYKK